MVPAQPDSPSVSADSNTEYIQKRDQDSGLERFNWMEGLAERRLTGSCPALTVGSPEQAITLQSCHYPPLQPSWTI